MKNSTFLSLSALLLSGSLYAQEPISPGTLSNTGLLDGKTIVKLNATGLATTNFGFTAERILSRRLSLQLGYNFMPKRKIPIMGLLGLKDPIIRSSRISSQSFTPELRIYISRGWGEGFYVSPYYRYERLGLDEVPISLKAQPMPHNPGVASIEMGGSYTSNSGGVAFGYQRYLGKSKNFVVDLTLGGHFGRGKLELSGAPEEGKLLNIRNVADIKEQLTQTVNSLPFTAKDLETSATFVNPTTRDASAVRMSFRSVWAFYRASISIGYRF